jgi:IS5 family transposase
MLRVHLLQHWFNLANESKEAAPNAKDFTNRLVRQPWGQDEVARAKNRTKNRTRDRVEHVFHVLKREFGFAKVRYRGLMKNANRALTALALVNRAMAQQRMSALVRP